MRGKLVTFALMLGIAFATQPTAAQAQGFETQTYYAGPRIWIGNLNGAVAVGGQIEKGFTKPGAYGSGIISGGIGLDYYSWSADFRPYGSYSYSVVPIQVFSNYHFVIPSNRRVDPYAGLALVYEHYSSSWSGNSLAFGSASASRTDIAGQVGARYFVSDKFAVQGQLGFGYGTISLGATWRL